MTFIVDPPVTIASLIESLGHPEKKVIRRAADALIAMAPSTPELAGQLERLLSSSPHAPRWPVAYVLAHIAAPSDSCLRALLDALGSEDPDVRWAAGVLLARLGKTDGRVLSRLREVLESGSSIQRRMAVYCIRDSDQEHIHLEALLGRVSDADPLVRVAAVTSLKTYRTINQAGLDLLLRLLAEDTDPRVRRGAALTLGHLGASNDAVRRALNTACQSEDPLLRKAANAALELQEKKGPAERE